MVNATFALPTYDDGSIAEGPLAELESFDLDARTVRFIGTDAAESVNIYGCQVTASGGGGDDVLVAGDHTLYDGPLCRSPKLTINGNDGDDTLTGRTATVTVRRAAPAPTTSLRTAATRAAEQGTTPCATVATRASTILSAALARTGSSDTPTTTHSSVALGPTKPTAASDRTAARPRPRAGARSGRAVDRADDVGDLLQRTLHRSAEWSGGALPC